MENITIQYAGFTKSNKEIYFLFDDDNIAFGQCLISNLEIVKEKFEKLNYNVIIINK